MLLNYRPVLYVQVMPMATFNSSTAFRSSVSLWPEVVFFHKDLCPESFGEWNDQKLSGITKWIPNMGGIKLHDFMYGKFEVFDPAKISRMKFGALCHISWPPVCWWPFFWQRCLLRKKKFEVKLLPRWSSCDGIHKSFQIFQVLQSDLVWTNKWPFRGWKREWRGHLEEVGCKTPCKLSSFWIQWRQVIL